MSKDYKGYELVKAIHDKEIKDNTRIEVHDLRTLDHISTIITYKDFRLNWAEGTFSTGDLFDDNMYFRVIEEELEIDIQGIEKLKSSIICGSQYIKDDREQTINKLVQAVKQLDRQINNK